MMLRQLTADRMVNIAHSRTSDEIICLGGRQCRSWVQKAKYSLRADVFRSSPNSGHPADGLERPFIGRSDLLILVWVPAECHS
jgi:hypothetical protein